MRRSQFEFNTQNKYIGTVSTTTNFLVPQMSSHRPDSLKGGPAARLRQQEATATNVNSPKGISHKTPNSGSPPDLAMARRRLSVVSDNKLVEGLDGMSTTGDGQEVQVGNLAIGGYAGISKKGYAPYNPRKKNQDSLVMEFHEETNSLLLCVFDGHGEAGDGVSQYFKTHYPIALFGHSNFAPTGNREEDIEGIKKAMATSIATYSWS